MNSATLQTAIYAKLSSDTTLTNELSTSWTDDNGAVTAIFSDVPQENADDGDFYPFISFGSSSVQPFDDKSVNGGNELIQIDVWTRSGDYIHGKQIAARVHTLLHRTSLTIAGQNHVSTDMETMTPSLDPDGETRRVLMLFRVLSQD